MPAQVNYYEILGLDPTGHPSPETTPYTLEAIKSAYREKALVLHPDRSSLLDALDRMMVLNKAYEVLKDPEKRREYDQQLRERPVRSSRTHTFIQKREPSSSTAEPSNSQDLISYSSSGNIDFTMLLTNANCQGAFLLSFAKSDPTFAQALIRIVSLWDCLSQTEQVGLLMILYSQGENPASVTAQIQASLAKNLLEFNLRENGEALREACQHNPTDAPAFLKAMQERLQKLDQDIFLSLAHQFYFLVSSFLEQHSSKLTVQQLEYLIRQHPEHQAEILNQFAAFVSSIKWEEVEKIFSMLEEFRKNTASNVNVSWELFNSYYSFLKTLEVKVACGLLSTLESEDVIVSLDRWLMSGILLISQQLPNQLEDRLYLMFYALTFLSSLTLVKPIEGPALLENSTPDSNLNLEGRLGVWKALKSSSNNSPYLLDRKLIISLLENIPFDIFSFLIIFFPSPDVLADFFSREDQDRLMQIILDSAEVKVSEENEPHEPSIPFFLRLLKKKDSHALELLKDNLDLAAAMFTHPVYLKAIQEDLELFRPLARILLCLNYAQVEATQKELPQAHQGVIKAYLDIGVSLFLHFNPTLKQPSPKFLLTSDFQRLFEETGFFPELAYTNVHMIPAQKMILEAALRELKSSDNPPSAIQAAVWDSLSFLAWRPWKEWEDFNSWIGSKDIRDLFFRKTNTSLESYNMSALTNTDFGSAGKVRVVFRIMLLFLSNPELSVHYISSQVAKRWREVLCNPKFRDGLQRLFLRVAREERGTNVESYGVEMSQAPTASSEIFFDWFRATVYGSLTSEQKEEPAQSFMILYFQVLESPALQNKLDAEASLEAQLQSISLLPPEAGASDKTLEELLALLRRTGFSENIRKMIEQYLLPQQRILLVAVLTEIKREAHETLPRELKKWIASTLEACPLSAPLDITFFHLANQTLKEEGRTIEGSHLLTLSKVYGAKVEKVVQELQLETQLLAAQQAERILMAVRGQGAQTFSEAIVSSADITQRLISQFEAVVQQALSNHTSLRDSVFSQAFYAQLKETKIRIGFENERLDRILNYAPETSPHLLAWLVNLSLHGDKFARHTVDQLQGEKEVETVLLDSFSEVLDLPGNDRLTLLPQMLGEMAEEKRLALLTLRQREWLTKFIQWIQANPHHAQTIEKAKKICDAFSEEANILQSFPEPLILLRANDVNSQGLLSWFFNLALQEQDTGLAQLALDALSHHLSVDSEARKNTIESCYSKLKKGDDQQQERWIQRLQSHFGQEIWKEMTAILLQDFSFVGQERENLLRWLTRQIGEDGLAEAFNARDMSLIERIEQSYRVRRRPILSFMSSFRESVQRDLKMIASSSKVSERIRRCWTEEVDQDPLCLVVRMALEGVEKAQQAIQNLSSENLGVFPFIQTTVLAEVNRSKFSEDFLQRAHLHLSPTLVKEIILAQFPDTQKAFMEKVLFEIKWMDLSPDQRARASQFLMSPYNQFLQQKVYGRIVQERNRLAEAPEGDRKAKALETLLQRLSQLGAEHLKKWIRGEVQDESALTISLAETVKEYMNIPEIDYYREKFKGFLKDILKCLLLILFIPLASNKKFRGTLFHSTTYGTLGSIRNTLLEKQESPRRAL